MALDVLKSFDGVSEDMRREEAICLHMAKSESDPQVITMRKAAKKWSRAELDKGGLILLRAFWMSGEGVGIKSHHSER